MTTLAPLATLPRVSSNVGVRSLSVGDPLGDRALFAALTKDFLIWDAFVGGKRRVDVHPLVLGAKLHESAVRTAEEAWCVVGHVADLAHQEPEELRLYGLSSDAVALACAARRGGDTASLVRVDLLLTEDGQWRACEVNVDSPGGYNEAVGLASVARAAGFRGAEEAGDPLAALVQRLCALSTDGGGGAIGLIHSTAHAEDLQIAALIRRQLRTRGHDGVLLPATALHESGGRLVARGRTLSVLYRYFPTEYMHGFSNVPEIAQCLESGAVRSLTSFSWYVAQSKFAYARAWARKSEFSASLARAVESALPFTVDVAALTPEQLIRERPAWVLKRALGRVGDQVVVGELTNDASWAQIVDDVLAFRSSGERWIAQRNVAQQALSTPWGPRLVTLGAYLCDGKFVGYFARLSPESHVSHDALCVPVFVERAELFA
jgi:hypothetical protein